MFKGQKVASFQMRILNLVHCDIWVEKTAISFSSAHCTASKDTNVERRNQLGIAVAVLPCLLTMGLKTF